MKTLTFKDFEGSAEVDTERQICRGKLLFIPDLVTYEADSPKALQSAFEDAVNDYLETCAELGRTPQKPFRGSFNVRVKTDLHRAAAVRAAHENVSLNDVVVRALECYIYGQTDVHNVTIQLENVASGASVSGEFADWRAVSTRGSSYGNH